MTSVTSAVHNNSLIARNSSGTKRVRRAGDRHDDYNLKTFTRWWDSLCYPRTGTPVTDLLAQVGGSNLPLVLLEALEEVPIGAFGSKRATNSTRFARLETIERFLRLLEERNIKTVNIGPEDLEQGNRTLVLGLTWTLIMRYEVGSGKGVAVQLSGAPLAAAQSILEWAREILAPISTSHSPQVSLPTGSSMADAVANGKIFCALVSQLWPDALTYAFIEPLEPLSRLKLAFDTAARLGVPKLLDETDVAGGECTEKVKFMDP